MRFKKELKNLTSQLIECKTTSSNKEEFLKAFDFIEDYFKDSACKIKRYKHNEVISAVLASPSVTRLDSVKVIFNGHIDVVPGKEEQFQPQIEKGRLLGRGALDMKGAVAAFLLAFKKYLNQNENTAPVAVMIPGDEETGGKDGTYHLLNDLGWSSEFAVIGEGRPEFALVTKEKGVVWLRLIVEGETAHSSRPWEGKNALKLLLDDLNRIREKFPELEKSAWKPTLNIASISTPNNTANKIPASASALLDIRFTEDFAPRPEGVEKKIKKELRNSKLETIEKGSLFRTDRDNPHLKEFKEVVAKELGEESSFSYNPGASDARFFAKKDIPAVVCGPTGGGIHADEEWVDLDFLSTYTEMIYQYLEQL